MLTAIEGTESSDLFCGPFLAETEGEDGYLIDLRVEKLRVVLENHHPLGENWAIHPVAVEYGPHTLNPLYGVNTPLLTLPRYVCGASASTTFHQ